MSLEFNFSIHTFSIFILDYSVFLLIQVVYTFNLFSVCMCVSSSIVLLPFFHFFWGGRGKAHHFAALTSLEFTEIHLASPSRVLGLKVSINMPSCLHLIFCLTEPELADSSRLLASPKNPPVFAPQCWNKDINHCTWAVWNLNSGPHVCKA